MLLHGGRGQHRGGRGAGQGPLEPTQCLGKRGETHTAIGESQSDHRQGYNIMYRVCTIMCMCVQSVHVIVYMSKVQCITIVYACILYVQKWLILYRYIL